MKQRYKWKAWLWHTLFPNRCPFCGECIEPSACSCDRCAPLWREDTPDECQLCHHTPCRCEEKGMPCLRVEACLWYHEPAVKRAILRYKQEKDITVAQNLAVIMAKRMQEIPFLREVDCIVPVPPSKGKGHTAYPHLTYLARFLKEQTDLSWEGKALVRSRKATPQKELSFQERRRNLLGAYTVKRPDAIRGKRVLLIDDVVTSGGTVLACAAALREAGAVSVTALAAATATKREELHKMGE